MGKKRKIKQSKSRQGGEMHGHGHDHCSCGHEHAPANDKPSPFRQKIEYVDNLTPDNNGGTEPADAVSDESEAASQDFSPIEAKDIKIIGKDDRDVTQARNSGRDDGSPTPRKRKSVSEIMEEEMGTELQREQARRNLLASSWHERDKLYKQLFGKPSYVTPANYGPPSTEVPADFEERSKATDTGDPGDPTLEEQHLAVLAYGPDPQRPHWTYVTAGLASPWLQHQPEDVSGFGCEFIIKSPVDAPWAPQLLRTLAFYVFNHAGVLSPGVRVGLNGSIDPAIDSQLRNVFIWYADEAPDALYELPSGLFAILCAVGITNDECQFAESIPDYGTWCINAVLRQTGDEQRTDPKRKSVMERKDINGILMNVKNYANTFRAEKMQGLEENAY